MTQKKKFECLYYRHVKGLKLLREEESCSDEVHLGVRPGFPRSPDRFANDVVSSHPSFLLLESACTAQAPKPAGYFPPSPDQMCQFLECEKREEIKEEVFIPQPFKFF